MFAAKTSSEAPSRSESLATHCLISGTTEERPLVRYPAPFFLLALLLLLKKRKEKENCAFRSASSSPSHLFCSFFPQPPRLIIQSCINGKANICLRFTFTDGGDARRCSGLTGLLRSACDLESGFLERNGNRGGRVQVSGSGSAACSM